MKIHSVSCTTVAASTVSSADEYADQCLSGMHGYPILDLALFARFQCMQSRSGGSMLSNIIWFLTDLFLVSGYYASLN